MENNHKDTSLLDELLNYMTIEHLLARVTIKTKEIYKMNVFMG